MANLPPGDPKLVSLIVNHLKSQGLFDQFRRDCLADVDTKPAYQNLRQRVDNFVSNHLANHTWSPHLNKNQLRNNIRQQVLKSGMLEAGIDRIITQVVDPKINHTFRPQVEKVVQDFLATLHNKEDGSANHEQMEEKFEASISNIGSIPVVGPSTSVANDAMSILETISSLNQEATAARALTENANHKNPEKASRRFAQQNVDAVLEKDRPLEENQDNEKLVPEIPSESTEAIVKPEDVNDLLTPVEDNQNLLSEILGPTQSKDQENDLDEQRPKIPEKAEKKNEVVEKVEKKDEKKEAKIEKKNDHVRKIEETTRQKEEKSVKEKEVDVESVKHNAEKSSTKQKPVEPMKDEWPSIDSDLDAMSDVTVSSVHTSDLSSFEEESDDEEEAVSDSTEEGEISSDDEEKAAAAQNKSGEQSEPKAKGTRHAYVHKPYLYSKYYSDSDDELTVEQRRQAVAKEKEERLLRRRIKRERLEEKRKQKAAEKAKALKMKNQGSVLGISNSVNKSLKDQKSKSTSMKEVLKEQLFLEKKVAMSKKRKKDSNGSLMIKTDILDEDSRNSQKSNESQDRISSSSTKDNKLAKIDNKSLKKPLEQEEETKSDPRIEREIKKKSSTFLEKTQDTKPQDTRKQDKFDSNSEEQKTKTSSKPDKIDKHAKKESSDNDALNAKITPRKESKSHRNERTYSEDRSSTRLEERTFSRQDDRSSSKSEDRSSSKSEERSSSRQEERASLKQEERSSSRQEERSSYKQDERSALKHKHKTDNGHKQGSDESDSQKSKKASKVDNHSQKYSKSSVEERSDRKGKLKSDVKSSSSSSKDERTPEHLSKKEDSTRRDNSKKDRHQSSEKSRSEHSYKRSTSDVKDHRESQSTSKSHSSFQKKSKNYPDDKNEVDSANSDNSRHEDNKDKKRPYSALDDKLHVKAKFKSSSNKSSKSNDQEEADQKNEKDKTTVDSSSEKYRKSKSEDKDGGERRDSSSQSSSSSRETSHKSKHTFDKLKERSRLDSKESGSSKSDKKPFGESSKSSNLKHSHKDAKRKEDGRRGEERSSKNPDEKRILERSISTDGKAIKKTALESKSENSKEKYSKKGSKSEAESDSLPVESASGESKDSRGNKKPASVKDGNTSAEEKVTDTSKINSNTSKPQSSETASSKKPWPLKSKSKHGSSESKDNKSGNLYKNIPLALIQHDVSSVKDSDISASDSIDETEKNFFSSKDGTAVTGQSDSGMPAKSTKKLHDKRDELAGSSTIKSCALEQRELAPNLHSDDSSISPGEVYSDVADSNDGEITTSHLAEESGKCLEEIIESANIPISGGNLEVDDIVTGNEIEGAVSVVQMESMTEKNERTSAAPEEQSSSSNVTGMETNIGSSIMESSTKEINCVAPGKDSPCRQEAEHDATATSSSFLLENNLRQSVDTASSSSTPVDNSADDTCMGMEEANLDNSREYTSSASADGNFVEDDGDSAMLSENSFEETATSSSSDRKHYEESFLEPSLTVKRREDTATCSQSTTNVAPEKAGNVTFKAATSSSTHRERSENAHENAASSTDNAEGSNPEAEILNHVSETATSSDANAEHANSFRASEMVSHVATSSESDRAFDISENITAQSTTSSSSSAGRGISERHTATSSSSMINSSRENVDGSLVSSELDSENIAASSSNVMDSSMGDDSSEWLKDASERENEDAASSSSNLPSTCTSKHSFGNVEDSKNTRATSSTQQDNVNEEEVDIISSGTLKEYPGNSSDLAMDSSTEASVSVSSEFYSGSAMGCSSSREDESPENDKYLEQTKEKDNTASSSSGATLAQTQTGGDEAASSSSSFTSSNTQHRLRSTLSSDNTEATASSSFATNSSSELYFTTSPGNSSDTTATSSSSSVTSGTFTDVNHSTHPTASSSVSMDSSTSEDQNRGAARLFSRTNTATSSNIMDQPCLEHIIKEREPASSSIMGADRTQENAEGIVYADKVNEQAATSSDMMDSSIEDEKACDALSNNNPYATTSTGTNNDLDTEKDMDDGCDVNSEAAAASSSNTLGSPLDEGDDNATSSDYTMDSCVEGMAHASDMSKNVEAASSSSFGDGRIHENVPEASVDRAVVDDATTSTSIERQNELIIGVHESPSNESSCRSIEMVAESSFVANHSNIDISGTLQEAVAPLQASEDGGHVEMNASDGTNSASYENNEEKEDTVSSASSEEQRFVGNASRQAAMQLGDGETDSTVTSAGTDAQETHRENSEASDRVTCAEVSVDVNNVAPNSPVEEASFSHANDQDLNEDQVSEASADNKTLEESEDVSVELVPYEVNADIGTENEVVQTSQPMTEEGEGAVTSTGITEESYGDKVLQGQDEVVCSEETETNESGSMNVPENSDRRAITEDDESAITSTGAKEDEEEGEGFVTSSGTPGEDSSCSNTVEHSSSTAVHTDKKPKESMANTDDGIVGEMGDSNSDTLECVTNFRATSELMESNTSHSRDEEITPCPSTQSSDLRKENKSQELCSNVSEGSQGFLIQNYEALLASDLKSGTSVSKMANQSCVEILPQSAGDFLQEGNIQSEDNLEQENIPLEDGSEQESCLPSEENLKVENCVLLSDVSSEKENSNQLEDHLEQENTISSEDNLNKEHSQPSEDHLDKENSKPLEDHLDKENSKPSEDNLDKENSKPSEDDLDKENGKPPEDNLDKESSKPSEDSLEKEKSKPSEENLEKENSKPLEDNLEKENNKPLEDSLEKENSKPLEDSLEKENSKPSEDNLEKENSKPSEDNLEKENSKLSEDNLEKENRKPPEDNLEKENSKPLEDHLAYTKALVISKDHTYVALKVEDTTCILEKDVSKNMPSASEAKSEQTLDSNTSSGGDDSPGNTSTSSAVIFKQTEETQQNATSSDAPEDGIPKSDKECVPQGEQSPPEIKGHVMDLENEAEVEKPNEVERPEKSESLDKHEGSKNQDMEEDKIVKEEETKVESQPTINPEEEPPVVKRKRGRPPKKSTLSLSANTDAEEVKKVSSERPEHEKGQTERKASLNKGASDKDKKVPESKDSEVTDAEKSPEVVKRRGRKKKHPSSSENDASKRENKDSESKDPEVTDSDKSPEVKRRGRKRKRSSSPQNDSSKKEKEDSESKDPEVTDSDKSPEVVKQRGRKKNCSSSSENVASDKEKKVPESKDPEVSDSDRSPEVVKRRGRKKKHSSSSENESSEPEKKRKKTENSEEDEEEDSESEDDETPKGATTRAASRLEAQSKKPTTRAAAKLNSPPSLAVRRQKIKSPESKTGKPTKRSAAPQTPPSGAKRKLEASPPAPRPRGRPPSEETLAKRKKLQ